MNLYFLRHGLAGDRTEWKGDDRERPLTKKGKDRTARIAATLDYLELGLDVIITSPLTRALQTAEITAKYMDLKNYLVVDERIAPGFTKEKLDAVLKDHPEAQNVMLVGHEPDFSTLVSQLTGGSDIVLKKGGVALVDIPDPAELKGQLVWLIPPKAMV